MSRCRSVHQCRAAGIDGGILRQLLTEMRDLIAKRSLL